jgi:UDP-N-acetylglucosamine 2-epimerase (non-hydrolysing)
MNLIIHITGARPNFPKAAPVIAAVRELALRQQTGQESAGQESAGQESAGRRGRHAQPVEQLLVHTGQHYDDRLSRVFFDELNLPDPDLNLGVGSGSHAVQTAAVMVGLEELFLARRPQLVVVYGDVNSTVAAALVAAKLQIPVAHVEAGLRSFDLTMPEEVNRRVTDQLSDLLFVTSPEAVGHLAREGIAAERIHFVGNPMIDTLLAHLDAFDSDAARSAHGLVGDYLVATLHRPANVDDPGSVGQLVSVLHKAAERLPVVIPLHPRGRAALEAAGLATSTGIVITDPLPYTAFLGLVRGAAAVITDSGGVQEETTVLGVPCLTIRPNTERPATISHGTNQLVSVDGVLPALDDVLTAPAHPRPAPVDRRPPLWDGHAGPRIAKVILDRLASA